MAITNYTELKSTIADWLNRDDLTSQIADFITLAESQLNDDIRHWRMEKRAETTIDGQFTAIPSDWLETIRFHLNANGTTDLRYAPRATMQHNRAATQDAVGTPNLYTHNAGQFEVYPTPDGSYSADLAYYAEIEALSDSNTTNWLLDKYSAAYLYGALIHSAPFLKDDERIQTWAALYASTVKRINKASSKATASGSGLKMAIRNN